MIARNVTSAAATRLGYGLAVARAVGRNSAALRRAAREHQPAEWLDTVALECGDVKTLLKAKVIESTRRGNSRVLEWRLTAAGRDLAGRL